MKTKHKTSLVIAVLAITLSSCYWHNWENINAKNVPVTPPCMVVDTNTAISYSVNIAPIIASKCAVSGCHSAGNTTSPVDYTIYSGPRGTGIAPACAGGLSGSTAWADINGTGAHVMPVPGNPALTPCETLILRNWILHGARNN
ncbi:MAG TPA: hypothetical protein VK835_03095 [Bacteroidia bacterium]|jgi:hypothetical protein|nr:hypothetical protein [Bacteroidia bacterium]